MNEINEAMLEQHMEKSIRQGRKEIISLLGGSAFTLDIDKILANIFLDGVEMIEKFERKE